MPTYCYETKKGKVFDRSYRMGRAPRSIVVDGQRAKRSLAAEFCSVPNSIGYPIECLGSGVNAADAGKLRSLLKRKGVPTDVTNDGNPVYTSANHQRRALKARGLHLNNSYC